MIAGLLPVTNPLVTMVNMAINAIKCRDAVIFSPHPMSRNTALEIARILRAALKQQGAPEDLILCLEKPSIPLAQELMSICDLTIATGGTAMVKSAYSSGKPAYGVGAGNATVVVDETADLAEAAANTRISKTQNHGSGCSCDGNLLVEATVYDRVSRRCCRKKAATWRRADGEDARSRPRCGTPNGHRTIDTVARAASVIATKAGFTLPAGKTFIIVTEDRIGKAHRFSGEKLSPVLAIFKYSGFDNVLKMVSDIFEVGGKGHSVGIASFDDDHIHRLALMAPVSRIMVRQPNVSGNAGSFTNGMPHDRQPRLRHVGRQHHQREHQRQALHEHDVGEPADPRGPAERAGTARRVLQLGGLRRGSDTHEAQSARVALVVLRAGERRAASSPRRTLRGADCIQLDLEDSVPASEKDTARQLVPAAAAPRASRRRRRRRARQQSDGDHAEGSRRVDWRGRGRHRADQGESADHVQRMDDIISRLESARGLRQGHTRLIAMIEIAGRILSDAGDRGGQPAPGGDEHRR